MLIRQNVADQEIPFDLGAAGATLADITVKVWKPGASGFGNSQLTNPVREIGDGWYAYKVATADVDTIGVNVLQAVHGATKVEATFTVIPEYPATPVWRKRPNA